MISDLNDFENDGESSFSYSLLNEKNEIIFEHPLNKLNIPKFHFLCKICNKTPLIELKDGFLFIQCHHPKDDYEEDKENYVKPIVMYIDLKNLNNIDNINNFIQKEEEIEDINLDFMKCKEHKEPYFYYCNKCYKNICKLDYNSHKEIHPNNINELALLNSELSHTIEDIIKLFNLNKYDIETDSKPNNNFLLKQLIFSILDDYRQLPNYNLYENIKTINELSKYFTYNKQKSGDIKKEIRVYSSRELEDLIEEKKGNKDDLKYIEYIQIFQSNFHKMDILIDNQKYLIELKELNLKQNNIRSIENLIKVYFPNLEKLILQTNMIDNKSIPFFFKFKDNFPKLKDLNVDGNNLTDFTFFESIQTLNNLMVLNVSRNAFHLNSNSDKKYIFNSMKEMILSNGVFKNKTIKIIKNFEIKNIELIDLSFNNLKSLDFIDSVQWPELNTLLLNGNNISEIEKLSKFPKLKSIEIKDNLISDIQKLEEIQKMIPELTIYATITIDDSNIRNNNINIYERSTNKESNFSDSDDD